MTSYCTLADVKTELKASSTTSDEVVRNNINIVSRRIDSVMGSPRRPFFAPYTEQRRRNISSLRVNSWENSFLLDYHILSLTSVLAGSTTITANVELYAPNNEVATMIRIKDNARTWYDACDGSDTPPYVVKVTGVWGFHEDYANAYDSVDTLAAAIVSTTATTLTVADVDGTNRDNFTPRISAGNLIRVGSELMDVLATNTTTNVVTVRRGVNGTTAATHAISTAVEVYEVDPRIRRIATRQTALLSARRGAFQVETLDGVGVVTYPQDLLSELRGVLQEFQYA